MRGTGGAERGLCHLCLAARKSSGILSLQESQERLKEGQEEGRDKWQGRKGDKNPPNQEEVSSEHEHQTALSSGHLLPLAFIENPAVWIPASQF